MSLTAQQLADCRRYMGWPLVGDSNVGDQRDFAYGWVSPGVYETLFHRLNNLSASEEATVVMYLGNLARIETGLLGADANIGTDEAAVWKRNRTEVSDRQDHFNRMRRLLCADIGLPPGPMLGYGGGSIRRC